MSVMPLVGRFGVAALLGVGIGGLMSRDAGAILIPADTNIYFDGASIKTNRFIVRDDWVARHEDGGIEVRIANPSAWEIHLPDGGNCR